MMAAKEESRRDYLRLEALDPLSGSKTEVLISYDRMQVVARRSMAHAKECGLVVPMILQNPTAVFEGLRQDEDGDRRGYGWRCYCGVPDRAFHPDGTTRSAYPGQVYLVFVNDAALSENCR